MCSDCLDEPSRDLAIAPEELARLARRIEADMSGEPAPAHAWSVYLGEESGALEWRTLDRLARAMDGARLIASMAGRPADPSR
ncbi:hypothetical protein [Ancylobacter oerskovii]|uniref:Uncharacterized protein n=1 Tax=Ancylobacter oerskovii TaxID=459519 RepID=A0ABW4YVZ0_9HYPH|nr:hypothetical protein [Ancylobacter oerskovii]MBS7544104.1 hypothetical protein [Ancylobacter oerskovii]